MGAPISHPVVIDPVQTFAERVAPVLRSQLGADVFDSWFKTLRLDRIEDATAHVTVRTRFLKTWLGEHYGDGIRDAIATVFTDVTKLSIGISGDSSARAIARPPAIRSDASVATAPKIDAVRMVPNSSTDVFEGSRFDPRLTFDRFHVGHSNRVAHSAARQVVEASIFERPIYNPLYIHGNVGLGKTHLLQALAQEVAIGGRRVLYLTAEKFMYSFALALKAQAALAFSERFHDIGVLVIDDAQFLQGKSVQQVFCQAIDAMMDAQKQIVIAADRPPADLEALEDRVRSRLSSGLTVEIGPIEQQLRGKLFESLVNEARAIMPRFSASADVVDYVASVIQSNGKDLAGAANRLLAHASLSQEPLTVASATAAIQDLVRTRQPKRVKIEDIQKIVAAHFNISRTDMLSSRRTANVVRPRQVAMYLSKVLTLRSLPEIGRRFGGRDHTTILHAVRKIERLQDRDSALAADLKIMRQMLEGVP